MPAALLDGQAVAGTVRAELRPRVAALRAQGVLPTLAVLLVGEDASSVTYVRNKERAAAELGIRVHVDRLPATAGGALLESKLAAWNEDPTFDGVVLQHPLPDALLYEHLLHLIVPEKDVDGLHPENLGLLVRGAPRYVPPTAAGILRLLAAHRIAISGAHVVIIGRGLLVGKPLALLLLLKQSGADATITVCHRGTKDLAAMTKQADILVAAAGVPRLVTAAHVRPGAVIVDVGIHKTAAGWTGDVILEEVRAVAAAVTPVPGGVGPMTVAMLLTNVVQAAEARSVAHR